jgi:preprotein translocase subunit YajC
VIIYLLVFVVIAFMLWTTYSQQRRSKKAQEQLQRMVKKGDEVLTVGGMFGTVRKVGDDFVILEVADRTKVRFLRRAIREIVNEEEDVEEDDEAEYVDDEYDEAEYDEQGGDDEEGSDEEEYDEEDSGDEADEADEAEQEGDGQELSAEAEDDAVDAPADSVRAPEPPTPPKGS